MQKIAIIGSPGAGKSTLALQLGALLGIQVFHLDRLHWKPGWIETPHDEWLAIQRALVARDHWIIDGNYSNSLDIRLAAADTIIFIDIPRAVCVWRVIRRRLLNFGRTRPDMGDGCREGVDGDFFRFVQYVWTYADRRRPDVLRRLSALHGKRILHLRTDQQLLDFLRELERRETGRSTFAHA